MKLETFIYPYGNYSDGFTHDDKTIVVYSNIKQISSLALLCSLEGFFVSSEPLKKINYSFFREEIPEFERKYSGKFHKF